jgi:hypothetical protein
MSVLLKLLHGISVDRKDHLATMSCHCIAGVQEALER